MSKVFEITSRYGGGPGPDPATMCDGQCEGMGWVPCRWSGLEPAFDVLWQQAHERGNILRRFWHYLRCDGWHFVRCPDCGGTGVRRIS